MRCIHAFLLLPVLGLQLPVGIGYHEAFDQARDLRRTCIVPQSGRLALEVAPGGGRWLAARGTAAFGLPVPAGRSVQLGFELTIGPETTCELGDDRDPQHGFGRLLTIAADGRLHVAGATTRTRLLPGSAYRFFIRWTWLASTDLALQEVRVAGPGVDEVVAPDVKVPARQGAPLSFRQSSPRGVAQIDEIRVLART